MSASNPASTQSPVIGVIAEHEFMPSASCGTRVFVGIYESYLACLMAAGAVPVIVPLGLAEADLRAIYERLDGVLLTGGGDVDPVHFHTTADPGLLVDVNPARDAAELSVTRWAAADNVPLLGICRGHQVVNVALGGTLYIDIPTEHPSELHHSTDSHLPLYYHAHEVTLQPDSRVARILGTTRLATNSRHHQAVRDLGAGLVATGHADDGLIEAIELPGNRFFMGVQWHPENMGDDTPAMRGIFTAMVEAARLRKQDAHAPA
jgi:putative glutamine amidotransferase